jgi:PAS domain S-box-containing protein
MHKLAERQFAKHLRKTAAELPVELQQLLLAVGECYNRYETELKLLKKSMEASGQELVELNVSLRKEREELLHNKTHLETSQRIAQVGSWELTLHNLSDITQNPLYWSDQTYRILDVEKGTAAASCDLFFSRVHTEDVPKILAAVYKALDFGDTFEIDHRLVLPGGVEKIIHECAEIFRDATGRPVKMIGTIQDVTELRKDKQQLEAANRDLNTLFENMQEAFFTVEAGEQGMKLLRLSKAGEKVYGHPLQAFFENPDKWFDIILEEDRPVIEAGKPLLLAGQVVTNIYRVRHGNGEIHWLESRLTPTLDDAGNLVRLDGVSYDITAKIEAEHALKKSEFKFRSLIENSSDAIMQVDEQGKTVFASDSFYRITGFTEGEVINKDIAAFCHPEDISRLLRHIKKVNANPGKTVSLVYRNMRKDGQYFWCDSRAVNLLHKPEVKGVVINFHDITERVKAEQALRDSEHKLRSLIQNSSDAILLVSGDRKVKFASDSFYRITGYMPQDVIDVDPVGFIYHEDQPLMAAHYERLMANPDKTFSLDYRRVKKDGSSMWCESIAVNLLHEPGVNGVVVNFRDITQRKETERALVESEHKFRSLIQKSSDAIIVLDPDKRLVFASDSLYRMTGFTAEESKNIVSLAFVHPDDRAAAIASWESIKDKPGAEKKLVYRRLKKDGSYMWVDSVITNLLYDPAVKGVVVNFRDITEWQEYEAALRATNENLKKTNNELDRFVYSVSHDLRAPLSSVLGIIGVAEMTANDEEMVKLHLGMMKDAVTKLDGFIGDILDYSRNARLEVKAGKICFQQLMQDVNNQLQFMVGSQPANLRVHISGETPFYSDKSRLFIVLNNLVSNAIRYGNPHLPDPFVEVNIVVNEQEAEISVKDNGIGIPADKLERIFDIFYRVSKKSTGSGLGLYIVKETVTRLSGKVNVQSELGKGSVFTVRIPNLFSLINPIHYEHSFE